MVQPSDLKKVWGGASEIEREGKAGGEELVGEEECEKRGCHARKGTKKIRGGR